MPWAICSSAPTNPAPWRRHIRQRQSEPLLFDLKQRIGVSMRTVVSDLADTQLMLLHMKRIAFALRMRERAPALAGDLTWFDGPESEAAAAVEPLEDGDDTGDNSRYLSRRRVLKGRLLEEGY